jgi:O-antigen ligase
MREIIRFLRFFITTFFILIILFSPIFESFDRNSVYFIFFIATSFLFISLKNKIQINVQGFIFLLFLIFAAISTIFSVSFSRSILEFFKYISVFQILIIVTNYNQNKKQYTDIIILTLLVNTVILSLFNILFRLFHFRFLTTSVIVNLFYSPYGHNHIADLLTLALPLSFYLFRNSAPKNKVIYGILLLFLIFTGFLSYSRFIYIYTIFLFVWQSDVIKKRKLIIIPVIISFFYLFITIISLLNIDKPFLNLPKQFFKPVKSELRLDYLKEASIQFQTNPLLGTGLNTFYHWSVRYQNNPNDWSHFVHNHFFEMFSETGLFGGLLFLFFIFLLLFHKIRNIPDKDEPIRIFIFIALCGAVIQNLLDFSWHFLSLFVYFIILANLFTCKLSKYNIIPEKIIKYKNYLSVILIIFSVLALSGHVLFYQGLKNKSDKLLEYSSFINFWDHNLQSELSEYYFGSGQFKKALKYNIKMRNLDPYNWRYHFLAMKIYLQLENAKDAGYERLLTLKYNPTESEYFYKLYSENYKKSLNDLIILFSGSTIDKLINEIRTLEDQYKNFNSQFNLENCINGKTATTENVKLCIDRAIFYPYHSSSRDEIVASVSDMLK